MKPAAASPRPLWPTGCLLVCSPQCATETPAWRPVKPTLPAALCCAHSRDARRSLLPGTGCAWWPPRSPRVAWSPPLFVSCSVTFLFTEQSNQPRGPYSGHRASLVATEAVGSCPLLVFRALSKTLPGDRVSWGHQKHSFRSGQKLRSS